MWEASGFQGLVLQSMSGTLKSNTRKSSHCLSLCHLRTQWASLQSVLMPSKAPQEQPSFFQDLRVRPREHGSTFCSSSVWSRRQAGKDNSSSAGLLSECFDYHTEKRKVHFPSSPCRLNQSSGLGCVVSYHAQRACSKALSGKTALCFGELASGMRINIYRVFCAC